MATVLKKSKYEPVAYRGLHPPLYATGSDFPLFDRIVFLFLLILQVGDLSLSVTINCTLNDLTGVFFKVQLLFSMSFAKVDVWRQKALLAMVYLN